MLHLYAHLHGQSSLPGYSFPLWVRSKVDLRILYRLWQINQKPVEELQELLGLDIPPIPEVSLAGITSDSILLYWKPPDNLATSLKHTIEVNGIKGTRFLWGFSNFP